MLSFFINSTKNKNIYFSKFSHHSIVARDMYCNPIQFQKKLIYPPIVRTNERALLHRTLQLITTTPMGEENPKCQSVNAKGQTLVPPLADNNNNQIIKIIINRKNSSKVYHNIKLLKKCGQSMAQKIKEGGEQLYVCIPCIEGYQMIRNKSFYSME